MIGLPVGHVPQVCRSVRSFSTKAPVPVYSYIFYTVPTWRLKGINFSVQLGLPRAVDQERRFRGPRRRRERCRIGRRGRQTEWRVRLGWIHVTVRDGAEEQGGRPAHPRVVPALLSPCYISEHETQVLILTWLPISPSITNIIHYRKKIIHFRYLDYYKVTG